MTTATHPRTSSFWLFGVWGEADSFPVSYQKEDHRERSHRGKPVLYGGLSACWGMVIVPVAPVLARRTLGHPLLAGGSCFGQSDWLEMMRGLPPTIGIVRSSRQTPFCLFVFHLGLLYFQVCSVIYFFY